MNIAIVGATGIVGKKIIQLIEERNFSADNFYLFSSKKTQNTPIKIFGESFKTEVFDENALNNKRVDLAFFATNNEISKIFVPAFLKHGCTVIDNSSAFRLLKDVPLIVPSINGNKVLDNTGLIANPNCSTIMLVPILNALKPFGLKRIVVSTYQAVSGAGKSGVKDLSLGEKGLIPKTFEKPIYSNCIPKIGDFLHDGYTEEEYKIILESRKILDIKNLNVTANAVRVPVFNCHAEALNVELDKNFQIDEIYAALKKAKDVKVFSDEDFPTQFDADGRDEILVGRIRRDFTCENALWLWAVSDNLRTGAATNAVKIAEILKNSTT